MKEKKGSKSGIEYFVGNRFYIFCISIISLICYGYAATNISVGNDDLFGDYYNGSGNAMLKAGRFGMFMWSKLMGYGKEYPYSSFAVDVIAIIMLASSAVAFCILLRKVSNDKIGMASYILFSCLFISYPLINEIWEYSGANACVSGGYLFAALSLLLVYEFLHSDNKKKDCWKFIVAVLLLTIICSSYESLAVVYVFGTFLILAMRILVGNENEKTFKGIIKNGLIYAAALVGGILIRIVVHLVYRVLFKIPYSPNGETDIEWIVGTDGLLAKIRFLIVRMARMFGVNALVYKPITYLIIAVFATLVITIILVVKYRKPILILPVMGMLMSLVLLSIIQGNASPYRACQVFAVFVAVTGAFIPEVLKRLKTPKWIVKAVCLILALVCVQQAVYLSTLLAANNVRSEEEAYIVRSIAYDLKSESYLSKPIIFTGTHTLSDDLLDFKSVRLDSDKGKIISAIYKKTNKTGLDEENNRYKFIQTNINSVIKWSMQAFDNQDGMRYLFHYYGTDFISADYDAVYEEAEKYVEDNKTPAYPYNGYIVDVGDYVIVNIQ